MPDLRSLLDELKRRKVVRTAALYAVVAWIVVEVASVVLPALRLPEWTLTFVVILALLGFPLVLTLAWVFEVTADGVRRTSDPGDSRAHPSVSDAWFREDAEPPPAAPGRLGPTGEGAHYYVADFQVNPADLEAWNAFYQDVWRPALLSAAEAGNLGGFVTLGHLHGGPYNWQIILFAPAWDALDDVWDTTFEAFGQHEERFDEILGMIRGHDDAIWLEANLP